MAISNVRQVAFGFVTSFAILCLCAVFESSIVRIVNKTATMVHFVLATLSLLVAVALNCKALALSMKMVEHSYDYEVRLENVPKDHFIVTRPAVLKLCGWATFCSIFVFYGLVCLRGVSLSLTGERMCETDVRTLSWINMVISMVNIFQLVAPFEYMTKATTSRVLPSRSPSLPSTDHDKLTQTQTKVVAPKAATKPPTAETPAKDAPVPRPETRKKSFWKT